MQTDYNHIEDMPGPAKVIFTCRKLSSLIPMSADQEVVLLLKAKMIVNRLLYPLCQARPMTL